MSIETEYKQYIKKYDSNAPTSIHTRLNDHFRISTIYRDYGITLADCAYGYETIIWDNERIIESESHDSIEEVLKYHLNKYFEYMNETLW